MSILKFGATWCQPCQMMEPHLAVMASSGETVFDVDVDDVGQDVLDSWGVAGVPTIFLLDERGEVKQKLVGLTSPAKIVAAMS